MNLPILLAAGAVGGLGNSHFVSRTNGRPKLATKGEAGMKLDLELELKLLADVGLVGLPNAGKSTLLRAITNSRARVGNWAFTTLSPNIGTVVLDNHSGRPLIQSASGRTPCTSFTIADIPGLIEGAHLDRGLGLGFLRHIERARVLSFVIDLSAGDAVQTLRGLWRELDEYQRLRERDLCIRTMNRLGSWSRVNDVPPGIHVGDGGKVGLNLGIPSSSYSSPHKSFPPLHLTPIYGKPWFVVGTKADLPGTQENYSSLRAYLSNVEKDVTEHPSGQKNGWRDKLIVVPVSAINAQGVDSIPGRVVQMLDSY
jgi:hypothetical protein